MDERFLDTTKPAGDTPIGSDVAERVLAIVADVARELKPGQAEAAAAINLETSLDRDLGFDSLARVELASRLESAFAVVLSDLVFAAAERPGDLVEAIVLARGSAAGYSDGAGSIAPASAKPLTDRAAAPAPMAATTLVDVLDWHAAQQGERTHLRFWEDDADGETLGYRTLHSEAIAVAAGLQVRDVGPGDAVAVMLPTSRAYFTAFCGTMIAGAIVVPIYPPSRATRIEEHVRRHVGILANAGATTLIVPEEAKPLARALQAQVSGLRHVVTATELAQAGNRLQRPKVAPDDVVLLQYTSGSTGVPKGVTLTHGNLLANIRAMADALAATPDDVFVSWLPLYHDMGLIGAWLASLVQATPLIVMSPLAFLARPARWLRAIDRHHATLSGGPNFSYELLLRHVSDEELQRLDLSTWRVAFNGAEPVNAATVERFCQRFAVAGFRRTSMAPVYGLAENAVGLAFPPLHRGPVIDRISRETLARDRRAAPAGENDAGALRLVGCGGPLPGHDIRIVDEAGFELPERREGRLQFRGPSATRGYWRNPEATRHLLDGDWHNSGDLAYLADGEVFITARAKDLIIRAGRNIHPADIEDAAGGLEGVIAGRIAAFGAADAASGTERLVIVAETRRRDPDALGDLRRAINARVADLVGDLPDDVVLAPPNSIPRTSSGKIRRAACRDLWLSGSIGKRENGRRARLRLAVATGRGRVRRTLQLTGSILFATWAWLTVAALAPVIWLAILALPQLAWRWRAAHAIARLIFRLTGTPLRVVGVENLTPQGSVLTSNHASYLDVLALVAALPRPVAFVAKAELRDSWPVRVMLERIGTCFVERFNRKQGLDDYRRIAAAAREGRSPLFFPEGTFQRPPGLLPFRMGAFACASETSLPVVPVVVQGTRAILPSGSWFPRPGALRITIAPPVAPAVDDAGWSAAVGLRDRVRQIMLEIVGEPDARANDLFARAAGESDLLGRA